MQWVRMHDGVGVSWQGLGWLGVKEVGGEAQVGVERNTIIVE